MDLFCTIFLLSYFDLDFGLICNTAQASLKFRGSTVLLSQPPKFWKSKHASPHWLCFDIKKNTLKNNYEQSWRGDSAVTNTCGEVWGLVTSNQKMSHNYVAPVPEAMMSQPPDKIKNK